MKIFSAIFPAMVIVGLMLSVTGCGQARKPSNRLEVWHWMADRDQALETLADRYRQQTGIRIKLSLFAPSDTYTQKIIAAAQADALPDIYGILDKRAITASFIKAGHVADLSADFQADNGAWEKSLYAKAVDTNRFLPGNADGVTPGIYGVPLDVANVQLVYNRALLKKAGIARPPATFNDWLKAIETLRRVGITPFSVGFGERWIINCVATYYAFNIMGEAKVMATFRGEVPYTDPDWIAVFNVFRTLAVKGAFIEGVVTKGNKYAEQDFALERAAFSFDGSWAVNIYRGMNPALDYGVQPLPPLRREKAPRVWGGAGSSLVVNDRSPNRDKAIAFLKWLTQQEQQRWLSEQTHNLPANRAAGAALPAILREFAKAMDQTTLPAVWPLNEEALVTEAFDRALQAVVIGERTPPQAAQDVQRVKAATRPQATAGR